MNKSIQKSTLIFIGVLIHYLINELWLTNYKLDNKWFALFYLLCFGLGFSLNSLSSLLSNKTKIQLGQSFMLFSFLKLVLLAIVLILVIKRYELQKVSTIIHFIIPYYLASFLAVSKLLKKLNEKNEEWDEL